MELHESGEMYLETILVLKNKKGFVRSIDIANEMNFSKPSVSRAMKLLKEEAYIQIDDKGLITLTKKGEDYAKSIYGRHNALKALLVSIGVDEMIAEEDACRIEHIISKESYEAIEKYISELK